MYNVWENKFQFFFLNTWVLPHISKNLAKYTNGCFLGNFLNKKHRALIPFFGMLKSRFFNCYTILSIFFCKKQKKLKFLTFRWYSNCPMKAGFGIFSQVKTPYSHALSWSKFAQKSMFKLFFQLLSWFFNFLMGFRCDSKVFSLSKSFFFVKNCLVSSWP